MITISAGHWGKGTGANGLIDEGTENIKVSKRLTEILRAAGIVTSYIQDTVNKTKDKNVNWLIAEHNKTSREIDVQIHFNSSSGTSSKGFGTEVLIYDEKHRATAQKIVDAIAKVSGLKNRGVKIRKDLGFLKRSNKPAFLIEVCFVNDSVDTAIYRRGFEKICQSIASELAAGVGKSLKPSTTLYKPVDGKVTSNVLKAREHIKQAVKNGVFTSKHENVDSYDDDTLIKYLNVYIDRLSK